MEQLIPLMPADPEQMRALNCCPVLRKRKHVKARCTRRHSLLGNRLAVGG